MDYSLPSPPGSSIHGIFQARILKWVAISFSRGSSRPRNQTQVSHTAGGLFTIWATKEATGRQGGLLFPSLLRIFDSFFVIHRVKGFGAVNKAKVDVFLVLSCFFDDPTDVGNLISGSSAFSKSSLNIWNFTVHVLLKPGLENSEHYFAKVITFSISK